MAPKAHAYNSAATGQGMVSDCSTFNVEKKQTQAKHIEMLPSTDSRKSYVGKTH